MMKYVMHTRCSFSILIRSENVFRYRTLYSGHYREIVSNA